jgi:hypothetical protein
LRRLSKAMKANPEQAQPLAATVARRLEKGKGPLSKADAAMIEEAAILAEKEGLSPSEMAEFSRKYASGAGLSQKPEKAVISDKPAPAPARSFEGNRQLIYTFQGGVKCTPKPCVDIRIRIHVTAGDWKEQREGGLNAQGQYSLQMPVMSAAHEKVQWHVEANDIDLRRAELAGERVTAPDDQDITLQNDLLLTAH